MSATGGAAGAPDPARFHLAEVGGEGLLVDLDSGTVLRLNETATGIWRRACGGETAAAIAEGLAREFGLDAQRARADVDGTLALSQTDATPPIPGMAPEYHYAHDAITGRYVLSLSGQALFAVDAAGERVSTVEVHNSAPEFFWPHLWTFLPKALSLRGVFVLHAAAVELGGEAIAFTGVSTAGKSTTARALAAHGAPRVSDDKMVIRFEGERALAVRGGEARMRETTSAAAAALARGEVAELASLHGIDHGDALPIREIHHITGRTPPPHAATFASTPIPPADAAGLFFLQSFAGSREPAAWKRQITNCVRLAASVRTLRTTTPDGLERLEEAARAW